MMRASGTRRQIMRVPMGYQGQHRREALLDAGAVASAALLLVFASTSFNRIPYPGARRYARPVVHRAVIVALPSSSVQPPEWLVENSLPLIDNDATDE